MQTVATKNRVSTGIGGLDEILHGGLLPGRAYVVTGPIGSGKTTLGLHFLEGARGLFIGLTEPETHIREDAGHLGLSLGATSFLDLTAESDFFTRAESYDIFSPAEVEREPMTRAIRERIEETDPQRIFVDGLCQMETIAKDAFHFQRLAQSLFRYSAERNITLLASASETSAAHSICDGVIRLHCSGAQRCIEIVKMRGSGYSPGQHMMRITDAGIQVFTNPT